MTWDQVGKRHRYFDSATGRVYGIVNADSEFAAWYENTKFLGNYTTLDLAKAAVVAEHGA